MKQDFDERPEGMSVIYAVGFALAAIIIFVIYFILSSYDK